MAISVYTGRPGSGKSYEVVRNVILPAFKAGRRIVTNIDGIDERAIERYLEPAGGDVETVLKFGSILKVNDDDITKQGFFPTSETDNWAIVQPGDLVVIDEAQNFYLQGEKVQKADFKYFRYHRHYTTEKGVGSDIVLLCQRFTDLPKLIRDSTDLAVSMRNLKFLGMKSRYSVTVHEVETGIRTYGPKFFKYDAEIFKLYKSGGMQASTDTRQNAFTPFRIALTVGFLTFLPIMFKAFFGIFDTNKIKQKANETPQTVHAPSVQTPPRKFDNTSKRWRIQGVLKSGTERYVVLVDKNGAMRFEHPQNFTGSGLKMTGYIDGEKVSYFSGDFKAEDKKGGLML